MSLILAVAPVDGTTTKVEITTSMPASAAQDSKAQNASVNICTKDAGRVHVGGGMMRF